MRGFAAFAAGVALCSVSSVAFAADLSTSTLPGPFYFNAHGGYVFSTQSDNSASNGGPPIVSRVTSNPGYLIGIAAGKAIGPNLDVEGELNYAAATARSIHVSSPVVFDGPATGSGSSFTAMVNAIVKIDGAVSPYAGAGIGVAYFTANNIAAASAVLNGSDTGVAYQFLAGINVALSPGASVGARYRYVKTTDLSLKDGGYTHSFNTTAQSVEVVLTKRFGN